MSRRAQPPLDGAAHTSTVPDALTNDIYTVAASGENVIGPTDLTHPAYLSYVGMNVTGRSCVNEA